MPVNPFSHIDLRVPSYALALPFYERLLPALGFTRTFHSAQWRAFAAEGDLPSAAYFAITEDAEFRPNQNMVGFWGADRAAVDAIAALVADAGGIITSGPALMPISPDYYAVFFEDPVGNKYEMVHRTR
jgi:catechol 2,3-dioxygenase-like lactoylglutathione lyase family enzyme